MSRIYFDLETDETLLVDMSELPVEALRGGAGMVRVTLRKKTGRRARVEIVAHETARVLLDGQVENVVKRTLAV